jgi:phage terminase large subunit-like protein
MKKKRRTATSSPDFWFDEAAADRAEGFFRDCLTHVKGEWSGKPFELADWQRDLVIRPLFGWKRADGTRRYRTAYIEVPRKAGKSTLGAGIALYLLLADGEPGAEVVSAAADREQAAIVFDVAAEMVRAKAALRDRCRIYRRAIVVPNTASGYKVISAEAYSKHGLNLHGVIFDELHAQPSRDLWDVLTTSTGARRQPLVVAITTAGYDRNSICWEVHDYAVKVRDGIIDDPSFLPVVFGADAEADWTSPATWSAAHPGLGRTVSLEYMQAECEKAQRLPGYENTFKRLLLNIWTEQHSRWLQMATWDACTGALPDLRGRECFAGLDLSTTTDLSALVLLFPIDGKLYVRPFFWVPQDRIRGRVLRDRVPYDVWVRDGLIEATEGAVVDYEAIRKRINDLATQYRIREIAVDRWNATQLATQLQGDGFEVVAFGQGFASMTAPCRELERLLLGGELVHDGNAVLRWMASNVSVQQDAAGNIKPNKAASTERIDGIVALVMALGRYMVTVEERPIEDLSQLVAFV